VIGEVEVEVMNVQEASRETRVAAEADVLVVGGGPSGVAAAVAAAREGAEVILVERYGCLGGLATGGLVLYMDAVFDGEGRQQIEGLYGEAMERLDRLGGLAAESPQRLHVDSEILKVVADQMCIDAGVRLRLHSWAVTALAHEGRVSGVIVESKSGREAILARLTVDATGDGDVAALAGAGFETAHQAIGLNYKIGGVDLARFAEWREADRERYDHLVRELREQGGQAIGLGATPYSEAGVYWVNVLGLSRRGVMGEDASLEGPGDPGRRVLERFAGSLSAVDVDDLTHVEVELRRRILHIVRFYRHRVPGFENVRLLSFASQLGVRDSRRIAALHKITREDVVGATVFPDTIGRCALSFGSRTGFPVPYRCLVPVDLPGILTAGRCVCADNWVQQVLRLIPPAMMTGQAAGTAAALCAREGCSPGLLETDRVRKALNAAGVRL
jgi:ribulose 1,5-bisphosphate synthetase/thiazole synthase